jgi:thioredoxin reductase
MPADDAAIERIITRFADAAAKAKKYGYGMVLIHAGHGWGLHQWLSPSINTRTDKWGGPDIENRARIVVAVCDAVRKEVGPGFPIEIRISGSECHKGGYDVEEGVKIAKQLEGHVDLIHVSAGNHEVPEVFTVTHPTMFLGDCCNVKYAKEIKKNVKTAVATIGAIGEAEEMEEIIASGTADVVELVRSLIADPDLPNKIRTGREDEIKVCLRCLNCFSKQQSHGVKYCAVNPESGHEHETLWEPRQCGKKKRVLIAGGGIGGMEAAITAAANGHEVILCEKNDELGGNIRCEKNVPFKQKLDEYLAGQEYKVRKAAIDVRLNTEVTPEYAESLRPDVIIAAMGARPIKPPIPGIDGKNVIGAEYAYIHPETVGDKAVVLGGGLVGLEIALYLAMMGKKITVVEMMDKINDGGNPLHIIGLNIQLRKYGIDLHFKTKAMEINEKGVRCEAEDGDKFFEADNVIYAVGQRPLQEEALALRTCAPEFYMVGDCVVSKNIPAATSVAHDVALNIGRV